jgi:hypothetical protein
MAKKPTSYWGRRADAAGLTQQTLAVVAGLAPNSVGRALRGELSGGVPLYLCSLILAWELLPPDKRATWLEQIDGAITGTMTGPGE